ncbi:MAG: DNA replication/repair protein RecF [Clostridiales bacterium]|nr:DNA replication/repair protein RecF [Clostridiales bacterium]
MRITELTLHNFRNFEHQVFRPGPGVNLICGKNAQGKTSLLEAVYILCCARSFRQGRERDWVRFGAPAARVQLQFETRRGDESLELRVAEGGARKEILLNGQPIRRNGELATRFCTVLFEPGHLNLVKEGPEERRRFLDTAIGQLRPKYQNVLEDYGRVVAQKNMLLRQGGAQEQLGIWNERLAALGSYLSFMRFSYVQKLSVQSGLHHERLSKGAESLSLEYQTFCGRPEAGQMEDLGQIKDALERELWDALPLETARSVSLVGPHRDDVELLIDGRSARLFGSQGQQRSVALSLKLGECALVEETVGEPPILLLDDVFSELDRSRQQYVRSRLRERQTLITTCALPRPSKTAAVFRLEQGEITALS